MGKSQARMMPVHNVHLKCVVTMDNTSHFDVYLNGRTIPAQTVCEYHISPHQTGGTKIEHASVITTNGYTRNPQRIKMPRHVLPGSTVNLHHRGRKIYSKTTNDRVDQLTVSRYGYINVPTNRCFVSSMGGY